jgi:predicted DNA-binding transcriptional regulator YafY
MLKMVQILECGGLYSIKQLAEKLEVSPRMIRVYKDELEQAGIYIRSESGRYGGYALDKELNKIDVGLTHQDISVLNIMKKLFIDDREVSFKEEFLDIVDKISASYKAQDQKRDNTKLEQIKETKKDRTKLYKDFRKAIRQYLKIRITYLSINTGVTERVIHPAELFTYTQKWYCAAFCELRKEIRLFKLDDIYEYQVLNEKYDQEIEVKKIN